MDIDPLQQRRELSTDDSNMSTHDPAYYRGYFSAVRRQAPAGDHSEPSLLRSILINLTLSAIPVGLFIAWQRYAAKGVSSDVSGMISRMTGSQRNFRVDTKVMFFKDIIGVDDVKLEVAQYVDFLKNPEKFSRLGARIPRGCLLTGSPGTGKTMLAKAVAGEAQVPFFACNGADFMELYVGSGPRTIRKLFEDARKVSPSIIFIDEIDAVGSRASQNKNENQGGGSGEENRTVNQLLTEMDGLSTDQHVIIVFAATNYVENVDSALLREGRFDRKVDIPLPDVEGRRALFQHYLMKIQTGDPQGFSGPPLPPNATEEMIQQHRVHTTPTAGTIKHTNAEMASILAELTPGVSPATISAIVNEAALGAAARSEPLVPLSSLQEALNDILIGRRHRSRMTREATTRVALHECGHTAVAWFLPRQSTVLRLSIVSRGQAAGFTQQAGRELLDPVTHMDLFGDLCVLLGGRVAEQLRYTELTTGAVDDLQRATESCFRQFLEWGMSARLGRTAYRTSNAGGRMFDAHSASQHVQVEEEAKRVLKIAETTTQFLLNRHKDQIFQLRDALLTKEELTTADIAGILGPRPTTLDLEPALQQEIQNIYLPIK